MFYVTLDSDGGYIEEDAYIVKFKTRKEAEAYLRGGYDDPPENIKIGVGNFADCWIKTWIKPTIAESDIFKPFNWQQLSIQKPGQHPGLSGCYWLTPRPPVLVVTSIVNVD